MKSLNKKDNYLRVDNEEASEQIKRGFKRYDACLVA